MLDSVIIGAGPAGVTASIYLKRANLNIKVFDTKESSLIKATIENYYGFTKISGIDLYNNGIKQLKENNIELISSEVLKIEKSNNEFLVSTTTDTYSTKTIILATGKPFPIDDKFKKYLGVGVSLCAHCDAPLYKNRLINVTGYEPYLDSIINDLRLYTKNIKIYNINDISTCFGDNFLEGIVLKNGEKIFIDNLFVATKVSSTKLYFELGILKDENDNILTNNFCETSVKGVYALGDIKNKVHQISLATSDGVLSSIDIIRRIKNA